MVAFDETPGVVVEKGFVRGAVEEDAVEAVAVGGVFVDVVAVGFVGAATGRGIAEVGDAFAGAVAEAVVAEFGLAAAGFGDDEEAFKTVIQVRGGGAAARGGAGDALVQPAAGVIGVSVTVDEGGAGFRLRLLSRPVALS